MSRFLAIYTRGSEVIQLRRHVDAARQGPDDNAVLDTAVNGEADFVVTRDKHLLTLGRFEGIRVVIIMMVDPALKLLSPS